MTNPGNWPDPAQPGVPSHPDKTGFHMIMYDGREYVFRWSPDQKFWDSGVAGASAGVIGARPGIRYLGPAQVRLTPEAEGGTADQS